MTVAISVVIPVYRDWTKLALCLDALGRQTLPAADFEIVVVNNEPEGGGSRVPLPANARVVAEPKPGSYSARNTGIAAARAQFVAFTDADCLPDPGWLANGLARLRVQPDARVMGPVPIFREPGGGYYAYLYEFHTGFRQRENAARGECITANMLVAKAAFDRVGPFGENLFSGGDIEWNRRAKAAGVPLIFDEAVSVRHPARRTLRAILKKKRRVGGGGVWAQKISTPALLWRAVKPPVRVLTTFDRAPIRGRDRVPLIGLVWLGKAVENITIVGTRWGLQGRYRS